MKVWLVKDGEQIPLADSARKQRIWLLGEELASRGHQVVWWSSTHSHNLKKCHCHHDLEMALSPNLQLRLLHVGGYHSNISWSRIWHHIKLSYRLRQALPEQPRPDLILVCLPIPGLVRACVAYGRRRQVPVIVDIRDDWPSVFARRVPALLTPLARLLCRPFELWTGHTLAQARALTASSQRLLDWGLQLAARQASSEDQVFYHGYPAEKPAAHTLLSYDGKVVAAFLGTFNRAYDLESVCLVAERLQHQGDDRLHFVLAGDGYTRAELQRRFGYLDNLEFPGWLNLKQSRALLLRADIGLLPRGGREHETIPNKPFEYMAHSLPILASQVGEIPAIIQRHQVGLLYRCEDVDELCARLLELARAPELRQKMAIQARRAFEENFSAERIFGAMADLVERVGAISSAPTI